MLIHSLRLFQWGTSKTCPLRSYTDWFSGWGSMPIPDPIGRMLHHLKFHSSLFLHVVISSLVDVIPTWALFFMGPAPCWSLAISMHVLISSLVDVIPTWALFFMGPAPCWLLATSMHVLISSLVDVIPTWALFFMGPAPCWSLAISIHVHFLARPSWLLPMSIRTFCARPSWLLAISIGTVGCPAPLVVGHYHLYCPAPLVVGYKSCLLAVHLRARPPWSWTV